MTDENRPAKKLEELFKAMTPPERINALYGAKVIDVKGNLEPDYVQALNQEIGRPGIIYVVLGFGYVEEAFVGHHVYQLRTFEGDPVQEAPETAAETVRLLAADFLQLYRDECLPHGSSAQYYRRSCCNSYLETLDKIESSTGTRPEQESLCPSCSRELTDKDINPEHFQEWLYSLGAATNDKFPCNDGSGGFGHWWPFASWAEILGAPKGTFLEIYEQAEVLITAALDPESFEGKAKQKLLEHQQDFLEMENRFDPENPKTLDEIIEKHTKRPGYGESVH
jgi:hypothetical protein